MPTRTHTPTATPSDVAAAAIAGEATATPTPGDELRAPDIPIVGAAAERIQNALETIANAPRQRLTLIVVIAVVGLLALLAFAYLLLRRR